MFKPTIITVTYEDGTTETFEHVFESDMDYVRGTIMGMIRADEELVEAMSPTESPVSHDHEYESYMYGSSRYDFPVLYN